MSSSSKPFHSGINHCQHNHQEAVQMCSLSLFKCMVAYSGVLSSNCYGIVVSVAESHAMICSFTMLTEYCAAVRMSAFPSQDRSIIRQLNLSLVFIRLCRHTLSQIQLSSLCAPMPFDSFSITN